MKTSPRLGFDIGGTFTDIVLITTDGQLLTYKIPSILATIGAEVGRRIEDGLQQLGQKQLTELIHASTIAANTMLEGKGAVAGFITTYGFRDELEIRGQTRPSNSSYFLWERIPPLIPRRRRKEVRERINAKGDVEVPLNINETLATLQELRAQGIESLGICFINSYVNPEHEKEVVKLAREILPAVMISVSYEVLPQIREYGRSSTTAINAYLMPVVTRYISSLENALVKYAKTMKIMQSNGGVMTSEHAKQRPIHLIESGPAAGVLAASALAREVGIARAVSFDMGGTTVKACLIENNTPIEKTESEVGGPANIGARYARGAGYALSVPVLDIVEAGAGGGSIAWVDDIGALRVGPTSANALPGPVCYSRGGTEPTVTDANVVLGYMNPQTIAGGTVAIDHSAAMMTLEHGLCAQLGLSIMETAHGIYQVANVSMTRAIRAVTSERGRDPREYTLIAFGGAGPIHAADLAQELGITRVYVPLHPGLFSALGLLFADLRYDYVQSDPGCLNELDGGSLMRKFNSLEERVRAEVAKESIDTSALVLKKFVDLRYAGQPSEMTIQLPENVPDTLLPLALAELFHIEHERTYGYRRSEEVIAIANIRLKALAAVRSAGFAELSTSFMKQARAGAGKETTRKAYFGKALGELQTRIVCRASLLDEVMEGPVIIEEFDTTIVVPPGWRATLDSYGSVVLKSNPIRSAKVDTELNPAVVEAR